MKTRIKALREALGIVSELDLSATCEITSVGEDWVYRIEAQLDRMLWEAYSAA